MITEESLYEAKKFQAKEQLKELIERYRAGRSSYLARNNTYNETQLRSDYLDRFLEILGWDVYNNAGLSEALREVIQEDSVDVIEDGETKEKNPDYTLRVSGTRKLFWEAKRPSVNITSSRDPAFQTRRYGWSASLSISVLSNFDTLKIYDTRHPPNADESAQVAIFRQYFFEDYLDKFDEVYDLLSRDAIFKGSIEQNFMSTVVRGAQSFDDYFLNQIERWRERLAKALLDENENLTEAQLNYLIQRLVNRTIFLRICEGRDLETYERLKQVSSYDELKSLFQEADARYNSGLFDFAEDKLSLDLSLNSEILVSIFQELYVPYSPYAFSVVEPDVLGEIYEVYLGNTVTVNDSGETSIVQKPEVAASNGVVATPSYIAKEIVEGTLAPLVLGKRPDELNNLRVADITCGSGTFLLAAYTYLLNYHLQWYTSGDKSKYKEKIYEGAGGTWYLSIEEKERILLNNIFGVDIDLQATEVTGFSLLLKLIENVPRSSVEAHAARKKLGALPNLERNIIRGNSLVDDAYYQHDKDAELDDTIIEKVQPLTFEKSFPAIMAGGGFNAIVGNPPYIRIQNMVQYSPEELAFYRGEQKPYTTAIGNIDKYYLFIERGLQLLREGGRLGYIVPHKFFIIKAGKNLRKLIADSQHLSSIVHFGANQVFPNRSTYTAIIILNRNRTEDFTVERIENPHILKSVRDKQFTKYSGVDISGEPWVFLSSRSRAVFEKMRSMSVKPLKVFADVFVGLQTSADGIYIQKIADFSSMYDMDGSKGFLTSEIPFNKDGVTWQIETGILVPCIYDAHLTPFQTVQPNAVLIFPYLPNTGTPYSEAELKKKFPKAWNYLNAHKQRLEKRDVSGGASDEWYRYGRSQSLTKFEGQDKLIWSTLALGAPYALDNRNTRFTGGGNGPYYTLRVKDDNTISIYYLLAVLSHPVLEAMVKSKASEFRGAYYSHGRQYISDLPIYDVGNDPDKKALYNQIVQRSEKLVEVTDVLLNQNDLTPSQRITRERQRDQLKVSLMESVREMYGLTKDDIDAITGDSLLSEVRDED